MGKLIVIAGLALVAFGVVWMIGERFGFGRLPGDIVIERGNARFYFPIASSIALSIIASLLFWLFGR